MITTQFLTLPTSPSKLPKVDVLFFTTDESKKLSPLLTALDKETDGLIQAALKSHGKFLGKKKQHVIVSLPAAFACRYAVILGTSCSGDDEDGVAHVTGGEINQVMNQLGQAKALLIVEKGKGQPGAPAAFAADMAIAAKLRSYRFEKYFTKKTPDELPSFTTLQIATPDNKAAAAQFDEGDAVGRGVCFARDLVSEPANIIYPETMAERCKELSKLGVKVEVLGEAEMEKLGMGSLLCVGQGSRRESKLIIMRWQGSSDKKQAPVAFVGKGVTFDTGGISLKPSGKMHEMKYDMGGSAAVIGTLYALAARKANINAVGVVGAVENMPDGNATRPGDVVTSMSGQTIEVLNTDAEGRLVLADALWYTQEKFKPRFVINLATLTGAIVVALGSSRAGLFSNDDTLAEQLFNAGKESGEPLWRLPMGSVYDKQIDSDIADMQNIGADREAGSITAAQFLKRVIKEGTPWAHLDIAGMAWADKDKPIVSKGASGFGVHLLNQLVKSYYEK